MAVLTTRVDPASDEARANAKQMRALVEELRAKTRAVSERGAAGDERSVARHRERGKMPVRERIDKLLDPGAAFLELSPLAADGMYDGDAPARGIITGVGMSAAHAASSGNDATVKGGTTTPSPSRRTSARRRSRSRTDCRCIYLVDSGGAFLPLQAEIFPDAITAAAASTSRRGCPRQGIPQIAVVMGSWTAGGAYTPAMSDETIIVRGTGTIFLGGPPLVKAATGEDVTAEELGGGDVHARISGVADHEALDDEHALAIGREIIYGLAHKQPDQPWIRQPSRPPAVATPDPDDEEGAADDPLGIYGAVSPDLRKGYDVHEVIARLVDGSEFHEFKAGYGETLITGFAHLDGYPIGILANNGVLFSESALKGAHFIELASQRRVPLVFLQNITGFMVGREYEAGGIANVRERHAVATTEVPKFTVIIGGSFGAGNYGMAGRAYGSRGLWMWPNARISVMGGEQAAMVLSMVGTFGSDEERDAYREEIRAKYKHEAIPPLDRATVG